MGVILRFLGLGLGFNLIPLTIFRISLSIRF